MKRRKNSLNCSLCTQQNTSTPSPPRFEMIASIITLLTNKTRPSFQYLRIKMWFYHLKLMRKIIAHCLLGRFVFVVVVFQFLFHGFIYFEICCVRWVPFGHCFFPAHSFLAIHLEKQQTAIWTRSRLYSNNKPQFGIVWCCEACQTRKTMNE